MRRELGIWNAVRRGEMCDDSKMTGSVALVYMLSVTELGFAVHNL